MNRQCEHLKDSLHKRGRNLDVAKNIAARTVNKERTQHGEAREASPQTLQDTPAPARGGRCSHQGPQGHTKAQLSAAARRNGMQGRSKVSKAELKRALVR